MKKLGPGELSKLGLISQKPWFVWLKPILYPLTNKIKIEEAWFDQPCVKDFFYLNKSVCVHVCYGRRGDTQTQIWGSYLNVKLYFQVSYGTLKRASAKALWDYRFPMLTQWHGACVVLGIFAVEELGTQASVKLMMVALPYKTQRAIRTKNQVWDSASLGTSIDKEIHAYICLHTPGHLTCLGSGTQISQWVSPSVGP